MNPDDAIPELTAGDRRRARGFRIAGAILLLVGVVSAGLVWWLGTRSESAFDEDSKVEVRQVETMYGKQGLLLQNFTDDLKQPGTQAGLLLALTGLMAAGCFYVAHLSAKGDE